MKKLSLFIAAFLSFGLAQAASIAVTISNGSLQRGTTAGFNVSSGTVQVLNNVNQTSSGTYSIRGGTFSWFSGVSSGTRFDSSTTTFLNGGFSGNRNDNSTTTITGGILFGGQNSDINSNTGLVRFTATPTKYNAGLKFSGTYLTDQLIYTSSNTDAIHIGGTTGSSVSDWGIFQSTGVQIKGTTTNNNARSGDYGEYLSSVTAVAISTTANTNQFGNYLSTALPAGDWDVSAVAGLQGNGASWFDAQLAISQFSGNTTTDHVYGDNLIVSIASVTYGGSERFTMAIPTYRISLASLTTIYMKILFEWTSVNNAPNLRGGRLSARRVR